jgi:uncharacterized integral membrane protein
MKRSPFAPRAQSANSSRKNSLGAIAITQLVILCLSITLLAAVFVQNLQPAVQIFFLGQKTIAIPLSVAMLVAFAGGGILAFVINAIGSWRQNLLIRRAVIAAGANKDNTEQVKKEQVKTDKFPSKEEFVDDNADDEYEDEEYEDDYEEEDEEEYEDDDPDTVPYGDRPNLKSNLKSKSSNQSKRDRPPLDAKFIR